MKKCFGRVPRLKVSKDSMLLYVVTDRTWLGNNSLEIQIEKIINAGATFIQLREKNLSFDDFLKEAQKIKMITDKHKIPFVINDNVSVCIASHADGIHIGQSDMNAKDVRKLVGNDKILGVSVLTVEQAIEAQKNGADYLGVGAMFNTSTKQDADAVTYNTLLEICKAVSIPVVAIGGINGGNLLKLSGSGVDGVAVISAIFAQPNVENATKELLMISKKMVNS